MVKKIFKTSLRSIQIFIIVFMFVFIKSSVFTVENVVENSNLNKVANLTTMALKVEEFEANNLYSVKDTFTGDLTGYVFNCPLCGGTLGCLPSYNIKDGRDYYDDSVYGRVNIVASSSRLACGTIVRFSNSRISSEPVIAIVLDRGVTGNSLDLLSPTLDYAKYVGRSSITYDVLRKGW